MSAATIENNSVSEESFENSEPLTSTLESLSNLKVIDQLEIGQVRL